MNQKNPNNIKILFSPSESKNRIDTSASATFDGIDTLFYNDLKDNICAYQKDLQTANEKDLHKIFGSKNINLDDLSDSISLNRFCRAIMLYNGVAYKALDFATLGAKEQDFINKHVLIFSNLYGAISPNDVVAFYNLHQNAGRKTYALKAIYQSIGFKIDENLRDNVVLDLRANAYKKVYMPLNAKEIINVEFIKNGKVLSHYAKLYRGYYLRELAMLCPDRLDFQLLSKIDFPRLRLIKAQNLTLTYEIQE